MILHNILNDVNFVIFFLPPSARIQRAEGMESLFQNGAFSVFSGGVMMMMGRASEIRSRLLSLIFIVLRSGNVKVSELKFQVEITFGFDDA